MNNLESRHLIEPIRLKIAHEFIEHEFRKLFFDIRDIKTWKDIDGSIKKLLKNPTLDSVRDFWNLFDALCLGLKLKNLTIRLTSKNIKWTKKTIKLDKLYFASKEDFKYLKGLKNSAPTGRIIKKFVFNEVNKDLLKEIEQDSKLRTRQTYIRDNYRLIVFKYNNKLIIADGNRRGLKAILNKKESIGVYLGESTNKPMFCDHWVPTSRILHLVQLARKALIESNKIEAKVFCKAIAYMIKDSKFGKDELKDKIVGYTRYKKQDKFILKEVNKML